MMTNVKHFAQSVVDSWNAHDLDRILSHYSEDFELTSPLIKKVLNIDDGTLKGKTNVRKWWQQVFEKVPDLQFEFIDIAESVDSMVLVQKSSYNNKIVVSNFYFNEQGQIKKERYFN
jgi:ketosteroid isomerase-like protein